MALVFHIIIALSSVAYTTYIFFSPSDKKLKVSYSLVGLTIATGTYLAWANPAHILQACTSGLLYVTVVSVGIAATHRKLASIRAIDK